MADYADLHSDAPGAPPLVDTPDALTAALEILLAHPRIAVDTESNSLYAYRERACLLQFSVPDADFVVDPLAIPDLEPLRPLFESPSLEKVFHAADYDLMVLRRDFGFHCRSLFDTMWAARVLGWPRVGLGDVLEARLGIRLDKRFQRYDWARRPLTPEVLRYAQLDSHYLLQLREIEMAELAAAGRWPEAQEIFDYLAESVHPPDLADPAPHFWRIKGVHDLRAHEQRLLYQLHLWREAEAQRLDRPPMKVLANARLIALAQVQPRTRQELQDAGLTAHQVHRFGNGILKALHSYPLVAPPDPPDGNHVDFDTTLLYKQLKSWRKEVAEVRGVDSDVILPNAALWELAQRRPSTLADLAGIPGIGPWRQATYGPDLLGIIQRA